MSKFDPTQVPWREPWQPVLPEQASALEAELKREVCEGHVLFGRSVVAVGRRGDDTVLFYLGEVAPRFAVVHLTFQQEHRTEWPWTVLFKTLEAWVKHRMIPVAEKYAS